MYVNGVYHFMFKLDEKYIEYVKASSLDMQTLFLKSINYILKHKFNFAYKLICKWKKELPITKQGLNCNWDEWYERGITPLWNEVSKNIMDDFANSLVAASAIFSWYSGISYRNVAKLLSDSFKLDWTYQDAYNEIHYIGSLISGSLNHKSYLEAGLTQYKFWATLDKRTCPVCGSLDGKIFTLKEKQVGVNYPPMHLGCRCTTISTIGLQSKNGQTRLAINSSGKRIKVPITMTWEEWMKNIH